jgi:hypothetical protein
MTERTAGGRFAAKPTTEAAPPKAAPQPEAAPSTQPGSNDAPTTSPPEKRGRGRPPKNQGDVPNAVPDTGAPPKRGRPRGKKAEPIDANVLAQQMQGLHLIAAQITGLTELQLSDQEAIILSNSVVAVCEEYGLSMGGKTGALLQLLAAAGMIYLPRLVVVKKRVALAKAQKEGTVIHGNAAQT